MPSLVACELLAFQGNGENQEGLRQTLVLSIMLFLEEGHSGLCLELSVCAHTHTQACMSIYIFMYIHGCIQRGTSRNRGPECTANLLEEATETPIQ